MELSKFLDELLGNIVSQEKLDTIRDIVKDGMLEYGLDFETAKVESQVFDRDNTYEPKVEISSDGYDDGEIIFIDYYID